MAWHQRFCSPLRSRARSTFRHVAFLCCRRSFGSMLQHGFSRFTRHVHATVLPACVLIRSLALNCLHVRSCPSERVGSRWHQICARFKQESKTGGSSV